MQPKILGAAGARRLEQCHGQVGVADGQSHRVGVQLRGFTHIDDGVGRTRGCLRQGVAIGVRPGDGVVAVQIGPVRPIDAEEHGQILSPDIDRRYGRRSTDSQIEGLGATLLKCQAAADEHIGVDLQLRVVHAGSQQLAVVVDFQFTIARIEQIGLVTTEVDCLAVNAVRGVVLDRDARSGQYETVQADQPHPIGRGNQSRVLGRGGVRGLHQQKAKIDVLECQPNCIRIAIFRPIDEVGAAAHKDVHVAGAERQHVDVVSTCAAQFNVHAGLTREREAP